MTTYDFVRSTLRSREQRWLRVRSVTKIYRTKINRWLSRWFLPLAGFAGLTAAASTYAVWAGLVTGSLSCFLIEHFRDWRNGGGTA